MSDISQNETTHTITALNDAFRKSFVGGSVYMTAGVQALGPEFIAATLSVVRSFDTFTQDVESRRADTHVGETEVGFTIPLSEPDMRVSRHPAPHAQHLLRV